MSTAQLVNRYIEQVPVGKPFTSSELMQCGKRAAVDQTLYRLAASEKIKRIVAGVYVRPEISAYVGEVLPSPSEIVKAIAKKTGETIQISGAEAARRLGLSTQVPVKPLFLTTGISRKFKIGSVELTLKHVSPKKIPLTESKVGIVIVALWYLGKNNIAIKTIRKIEQQLTPSEFNKLLGARAYMPAWMSDLVLEYQSLKEIANA